MSLRNPLIAASALAAGTYFLASYASAHSVGTDIPTKRENLRQEGAQAELQRAAGRQSADTLLATDVRTKGGDKGLKSGETFG